MVGVLAFVRNLENRPPFSGGYNMYMSGWWLVGRSVCIPLARRQPPIRVAPWGNDAATAPRVAKSGCACGLARLRFPEFEHMCFIVFYAGNEYQAGMSGFQPHVCFIVFYVGNEYQAEMSGFQPHGVLP